jgi:hypothetical protein
MPGAKFGRSSISKAAMRPLVVVIFSPQGNLSACIGQVPEPIGIQAFIPESGMKALYNCILGRLAGLDVNDAYALLFAPGAKLAARELWVVIGSNRTGRP